MKRFLVLAPSIILVCVVTLYYCTNQLDNAIKTGDTGIAKSDPYIADSIQCVKANGPDDNAIDIIKANGFEVDYRDDVWYIDGEPVGMSPNEDEEFVLCGETIQMQNWLD